MTYIERTQEIITGNETHTINPHWANSLQSQCRSQILAVLLSGLSGGLQWSELSVCVFAECRRALSTDEWRAVLISVGRIKPLVTIFPGAPGLPSSPDLPWSKKSVKTVKCVSVCVRAMSVCVCELLSNSQVFLGSREGRWQPGDPGLLSVQGAPVDRHTD